MTRKVHDDTANPLTGIRNRRAADQLARLNGLLDSLGADTTAPDGTGRILDPVERTEALLESLDDEHTETLQALTAGRGTALQFRAAGAVVQANRCVDEAARLLCDFGAELDGSIVEQAEAVGWLADAAYRLMRAAAIVDQVAGATGRSDDR
jgi:hypothetical protein